MTHRTHRHRQSLFSEARLAFVKPGETPKTYVANQENPDLRAQTDKARERMASVLRKFEAKMSPEEYSSMGESVRRKFAAIDQSIRDNTESMGIKVEAAAREYEDAIRAIETQISDLEKKYGVTDRYEDEVRSKWAQKHIDAGSVRAETFFWKGYNAYVLYLPDNWSVLPDNQTAAVPYKSKSDISESRTSYVFLEENLPKDGIISIYIPQQNRVVSGRWSFAEDQSDYKRKDVVIDISKSSSPLPVAAPDTPAVPAAAPSAPFKLRSPGGVRDAFGSDADFFRARNPGMSSARSRSGAPEAAGVDTPEMVRAKNREIAARIAPRDPELAARIMRSPVLFSEMGEDVDRSAGTLPGTVRTNNLVINNNVNRVWPKPERDVSTNFTPDGEVKPEVQEYRRSLGLPPLGRDGLPVSGPKSARAETERKVLELNTWDEVQRRLEKDTWGTVRSGTKDTFGDRFIYKINKVGTMNRYSPKTGLWSFNVNTAIWTNGYKPNVQGKDMTAAADAYAKLFAPIVPPAAVSSAPASVARVENAEPANTEINYAIRIVDTYKCMVANSIADGEMVRPLLPALEKALARLNDDEKKTLADPAKRVTLDFDRAKRSGIESGTINLDPTVSVADAESVFYAKVVAGLAEIKRLKEAPPAASVAPKSAVVARNAAESAPAAIELTPEQAQTSIKEALAEMQVIYGATFKVGIPKSMVRPMQRKMGEVARALEQLSPEEKNKLKGLTIKITTKPDHDTYVANIAKKQIDLYVQENFTETDFGLKTQIIDGLDVLEKQVARKPKEF